MENYLVIIYRFPILGIHYKRNLAKFSMDPTASHMEAQEL